MQTLQDSFQQALKFHRAGALRDAEWLYREILRIDPCHSDALHLLGVVAHQSQRPAEAIQHIRQAIVLKPHSAIYYNNYAAAHRALGDAERAVTLYRFAVNLKPEYAEAWKNLGSLHLERRELNEAADCYRRAVEIAPHDADSWFRLGNISNGQGRTREARECFCRSLEIESGHAEANFNLGNALRADGEREEAVRCYRGALQAVPNFSEARINLSATYCELGQEYEHEGLLQKASVCFQHALASRPTHPTALVSLGNVLKAQDETSGAAACYRQLLRGSPKPAALELWLASLCPAVFPNSATIDEYRGNLSSQLERMLHDGIRLEPSDISTLGSPVPYNLQFHGRDDRAIKEAFAALIGTSIHPAPVPRRSGPRRVGFVVTAGHEGAFLRYLRGALVRMQGARFERVIVCPQQSAAYLAREIADESVRRLAYPHRFEDAVEVIRRAEFDVLYHWEVGSDVFNYFLPFYRLAPIQCTSAGLPATTGIPAMDYFLSHDLAEPADADRHYSEKLIRAGSQLSHQRRMSLPSRPKARSDFGFSGADHLYVCAQKIEKFHPEFDAFLAEILRRDERGKILIPRDKGGYRARKLQRRMATIFPDVVGRVAFLPRLELNDYLSLLDVADVVLDPLHYGGGLTAYDAFSLNKPVVTLPTKFVRGRYTHGFYRKMGINDCTVTTSDEYAAVAVALGTNAEKRRELSRRIAEASSVLFEDEQSARDYERIFDRLINEARASH